MNSLMIEIRQDVPSGANDVPSLILSNNTSRQENLSAEQLLIYARKMAFCKDRLTALLLGSKPGLLAMAEEFIAQQKANTKLSEIINQNSTQHNPIQESNFVQHTPKQLAEKLFLGFAQLLRDIENNPEVKITSSPGFLKDIQFLPRFLHLVMQRLENNYASDLTKRELARLNKQEKQMYEARVAIINHNQRLVQYAAKQYAKKSTSHIDLAQEGMIGLIKAVDRYDWKRSIKFSTYAMYWVRQTISRAICRQEKIIRLPFNLAVKAPAIYATMKQYLLENNKWPTNAKLASLCDTPEDEINIILEHYHPTVSLNSQINNDEQMPELQNLLIQQQFPSALRELMESDKQTALSNALKHLSEREAEVINNRFGLFDYQEMTLQEIGDKYGLTRERVRQVQNSALRKLKKYFSGDLSDFMDSG